MKNRFISLLMSVILALSLTTVAIAEEETKWSNASDWAIAELEKAQEKSLIPQILNDADFTKQVTREEFAEISVKVYEVLSGQAAEASEENPFTDTENPEILKAYNLGITNGITETTFVPADNLTREQAATMLSRSYMKAFSLEALPQNSDYTAFADDDKISDWAKESVYYMAANGIINGVSEDTFAPKYTTDEEKESGYGCATREQALLIAVRICDAFAKTEADDNTEDNTQTDDKEEVVEPQAPIIEVVEEPIVSNKKENDYVIAFIGGSLTDSNSVWVPNVIDFYKRKYPDKNIVRVDAGIGGTQSTFGAMRYRKNVLTYEPDLVFIEFPVNDTGFNELAHVYGMESMIRQSLELENVPNIVILFTPHAVDKDSDTYERWLKTVDLHKQVADNYGIPTINIYDYMYADFEAGNRKTFSEYLAMYYKPSGDGFDVHGGYEKYAEAILAALGEDFDKYNVKPTEADICTSDDARLRYKWTPSTSKDIEYTELVWKRYKKAPGSVPDKHDIPTKYFSEKFFPDGVYQTEYKDAAFTFKSTPGAEAFCLSYIASSKGASATVTIDGKEAGTVSCYSQYHGYNYNTNWIEIPYDGESHTITVTVDGIDEEHTVFRYGAIVERYRK